MVESPPIRPNAPLIVPSRLFDDGRIVAQHLSMDPEIKEEFAGVRADLRSVGDHVRELDARVSAVDARVSAVDARVRDVDARVRDVDARVRDVDVRVREVEVRVRDVDTRLSEVDTRLTAEIRRVETTLREEIREEGVATRRHFDVVAESLRDDIRIIAEGFVALDAKVERMRDSR